eukprot:1926592-Prymnesium_polylepis.1
MEGAASNVRDTLSLIDWVLSTYAERCQGGPIDTPAAALLIGPPAAGKTVLLNQLITRTRGSELVPISVSVQRLQKLLLEQPDAFAATCRCVELGRRLPAPRRSSSMWPSTACCARR